MTELTVERCLAIPDARWDIEWVERGDLQT